MKTAEEVYEMINSRSGKVWNKKEIDIMVANVYANQFKTQWVNVDYALPELDAPFLVIDKWGYMSVCGYNLDIGWYPKIDGIHPDFESEFISHWRPLPELP